MNVNGHIPTVAGEKSAVVQSCIWYFCRLIVCKERGFTTNAAPTNATARTAAWRAETFSPMNIQEKRTVKNGAVLFSIIASPIGILDSA